MTSLVKWIVGVSSAGFAVVGGGYVITQYATTGTTNTPSSKRKNLKMVDTSSSSLEPNSMAKLYGKYLLDTTSNKEKWNDIFENKILDTSTYQPDIHFNNTVVASGFSDTTSNTALNKTCQTYYQKEIKSPNDSDTGKIDPNNTVWKDIWALCSPRNPTFIDPESQYEEGSIGKNRANELLSTSSNQSLWEEKERDFFSLPQSPTEAIFKALYETKDQANRGKLKDKCEMAYKNKPSTAAPSEDEVIKYCSMKAM